MNIDLIIGGIAVLAFIVLIVITLRKFPQVASINLQTIQKHVQQRKKILIIEQRLQRKLTETTKNWIHKMNPTKEKMKSAFQKIQNKIQELEKKYTESSKPKTAEEKEKNRQKVGTLLEEAKELLKLSNYAEAEQKYIEIISHDHKNIDAYRGLNEVYTGQKNWENAKEALLFLIKIDPKNDVNYFDLAWVHQQMDHMKEAFEALKKAVQLKPNDPKNLAALLELSLTFDQKYTAKKSLEKIKEVNPDNQKIPEWQEKIANMGK